MCLVAMEVGALRLRQVFTVVLKKFTVEFNTMVLNSHYYTKYARLEFINQWSRVKTKLEYLIWKTSFSFRLIKKKKNWFWLVNDGKFQLLLQILQVISSAFITWERMKTSLLKSSRILKKNLKSVSTVSWSVPNLSLSSSEECDLSYLINCQLISCKFVSSWQKLGSVCLPIPN